MRRCWLPAAALLLRATPAAAQFEGSPEPCRGQTITDVQINVHPPYEGSGSQWWDKPIRVVNALHVTTDPNVVRRFLLLHVKDPCSEFRRAESERILRVQRFIRDASVRTVSDGQQGVILIVETRDEFTPVLSVDARGKTPYLAAFKIGEGNLGGNAIYADAQWHHGAGRDLFGSHVIDYQLFGRPWVMDLTARRGDIGEYQRNVDLTHPFYTDAQRVAWRVTAGDRRELFDFQRSQVANVELALERRFYDIGGVIRIGPPGLLSLFGVSFSSEDDVPGPPPVLDSAGESERVLGLYSHRRNSRVNALWGVRNLSFIRVARFDALDALQDVGRGFQLGMLFGRALSYLGTSDDDFLVASDLYMGAGGVRSFAIFQSRMEGRQNYTQGGWDGVIGVGRLSLYQRLTGAHTLYATAEYGGGWRARVPFQLTLSDLDGGVRGFHGSDDGGASRAVGRLEDRWFLGSLRGQADIGIAGFVDAGRLWAGDAPFGVNTPVRVGAGIGLLTAIPAGSRRTWRVDLAYPVNRDPGSHFELRLTNTEVFRTTQGWREPGDVAWSREQVVPASVFGWP